MRLPSLVALIIFGSMSLFAGGDRIASQPPGQSFPWPRATRLTALEDLILAIPAATLEKDEKIGSVIHSDPETEIKLQMSSAESFIYLRLKAGMSVWLSKSVEGVVVASDKRPRRIKISPVKEESAR